ncbi:MAG: cysteine methyltransferase [Candidatus Cloacimonetes bacterium HGW-Cloacimonetes-3]|jgi:methylated-DNA-[protein]-cysteine S-methyltransferase|nr:MAG: cysteine methyltransferase [Candidatus Cloacimonetes bacterium HGW-Cloacimonetes-3]
MDKRLFYRAPSEAVYLLIELEEDTIIGVNFCAKQSPSKPITEMEKELFHQLDAYFEGELTEFDLPYFATGTVFQLMVWEELLKIPYGETITYGELAARIGKPKAARAVGGALHRNPVAILLPCHRVLGSKGALTGFAGGTDTKQHLLDLERNFKP